MCFGRGLKFENVLFAEIEELERFMKAMLYVSVNFHHSFSFETNSSKTLKKVLQDTLHSEERRLTSFFSFLGAAKFLVGAYVLFIIFRYTRFTLLKFAKR